MKRGSKKASKNEHRLVLITGAHKHYLHNGIATAKYNPATFLPKFLFEQFRRYSNIFFLLTALMQQIPDVSPTGRYTTIIPLVFIITVSAVKEIYEDFYRHKEDWLVNRTEGEVVNRLECTIVQRKWKQICVGDLVVVRENCFFPADLVLLTSKEPNGLCYIETANLDGETNLKARTSLRVTDQFCSKQAQLRCAESTVVKELDLESICSSSLIRGVIECDKPNKQLYEFDGRLKMDGEQYPISNDNVLLRGAKLRNTAWVLGIVIYTGHETKLMMNYSASTPIKQSLVEKTTNRQILALLAILLVMCLVSAAASVAWIAANNGGHWYIINLQSKSFLLSFMTFIILYNNLIPISLQVTLEMVRVIQAHFINSDLQMYDKETDTPAMARTSNLNEELGNIRYILSDKTGTLTRNIMEFKKCSIAGKIYDEKTFGDMIDQIKRRRGAEWERLREFCTLLAVCHTVIPEPNKNYTGAGARFTYTASSPDEAALVRGAQRIGFEFLQRTPRLVVIDALGVIEKYEILSVLEFNSDRKRMSVICRNPAGRLKLYIKGADSIIAQRLTIKSRAEFTRLTEPALCQFANEGLRTLCVACANIDEKRFRRWESAMRDAMLLTGDMGAKQQTLDRLMSSIECSLTLLGATAIEDQLQVGVPETIHTLMQAGISIWMLTGDKQETAINIGYSCRLLKNAQELDSYHIINAESVAETALSIEEGAHKVAQSEVHNFTLVIDCKSLSFALSSCDLQARFIAVASQCRSVICCRVTPAQKAEIVEAVKRHTGAITLAIGDGANDVAMIRAAHVGVGICGQEGLQAVYSSDYAIAQFRFLARLLLVHGSWSLSRICKLIFYSFYKNIVLYVIELWFATESAWSGQAGFERWSLSLYNLVFTAFPPIAFGVFDRICSAEMLLDNAQLYRHHTDQFSLKLFWFWIASAIWHSLLLYFLSCYSMQHEVLWPNGKPDGGIFCFANILFTYVVITVCLKAALETSCWTTVTHVAIWGSIVLWFGWLILYSRAWPHIEMGGVQMASVDHAIFSTWIFWLGMVIIPFLTLLVDIVVKLVTRTCFKSQADMIIELELARTDQAMASKREQQTVGLRALVSSHSNIAGVRSSGLQVAQIDAAHGYSFSQVEGSPGNDLTQATVIRMYNTQIAPH